MGQAEAARVAGRDIQTYAEEGERHILERMLVVRSYFEYGGYDRFGQELTRLQMRGVVVSDIVPLLCATGRCVLRASAASAPASATALSAPIEWDERAAWVFTAGIRNADGGYLIEGWFARGDDRMEQTDPVLVVEDGILSRHTRARLDVGDAFAWLAALRRTSRITVPLESRDELIDVLLARRRTWPASPTIFKSRGCGSSCALSAAVAADEVPRRSRPRRSRVRLRKARSRRSWRSSRRA